METKPTQAPHKEEQTKEALEAATRRSIQLPLQANLRRESTAVEKELKGFYVDFIFDKLNLTKYR